MNDPQGLLFEIPEDLRKEMVFCATVKGVKIDWLIDIYRRGVNARLGATGEFPYGRLAPDDEGELSVAMGLDVPNGVIRLVFGKPIAWLALPAAHAKKMAEILVRKAEELERRLP